MNSGTLLIPVSRTYNMVYGRWWFCLLDSNSALLVVLPLLRFWPEPAQTTWPSHDRLQLLQRRCKLSYFLFVSCADQAPLSAAPGFVFHTVDVMVSSNVSSVSRLESNTASRATRFLTLPAPAVFHAACSSRRTRKSLVVPKQLVTNELPQCLILSRTGLVRRLDPLHDKHSCSRSMFIVLGLYFIWFLPLIYP